MSEAYEGHGDPVFEITVGQLEIQFVLTKDGQPVGACKVQARPCCPPRFMSEFGLTHSELADIKDEVEDIRDYFGWREGPTEEHDLQ